MGTMLYLLITLPLSLVVGILYLYGLTSVFLGEIRVPRRILARGWRAVVVGLAIAAVAHGVFGLLDLLFTTWPQFSKMGH